MLKKIRKYIIALWAIVLLCFGIYLFNHRYIIDPAYFVSMIQDFGTGALFIYFIVFLFRGLLLVPSTPLILVGMLLFPENPHIVFLISMVGIVFSSLIIYEFSDILGLDEYYAKHNHSKKMRHLIDKYGFFAVAFWSFFLILPTDLVCYIAGMVRMNIYKFIAAICLGEGLVIGIFIYGGGEIVKLFGF
ncbi:VTT domain-containing protein [Candidatus Gracilibacteria bacterium]|nr:VTT domain-containing protein [Candidatus Gracilibacteria bacterium]